MKITDLEFYLLQVPRAAPLKPVRSLLIRLATDAGVDGWGEMPALWRADELGARRDVLMPTLAGRNVCDIEELIRLDVMGSAPLCCGIEMACWDALGRISGQPLCHLFGGLYRRGVPLAVRLPPGDFDEVAVWSREYAARGFHTQVVCGSGQPEDDATLLAAVHAATGDRIELRIDAANAYDLESARELDTLLRRQSVQLVLDPLRDAEFDQVASLRRQTALPLAISTGIVDPASVLAVVRSGAAQHVVVDLEQVGGLSRARACATVAETGEIVALLGGRRPTLGVATAALVALVAATPGFASADESSYPQLADDVLVESLPLVDGMLSVPQGPGLGVEIDRAKVDRYLVT